MKVGKYMLVFLPMSSFVYMLTFFIGVVLDCTILRVSESFGYTLVIYLFYWYVPVIFSFLCAIPLTRWVLKK